MPETSATPRRAAYGKPRFKYAFMYAHQGEGDTWFQVFSENLRRLRTKRTRKPNARGPVPVIAGSDEAAAILEGLRLQSVQIGEHKLAQLGSALHRCGQGSNENAEEIARLTTHLEHFRTIMDEEKEVGKRLDFLTQELNREANTITSKTNNMTVKENALEIKSEIEKIREQVQNVE